MRSMFLAAIALLCLALPARADYGSDLTGVVGSSFVFSTTIQSCQVVAQVLLWDFQSATDPTPTWDAYALTISAVCRNPKGGVSQDKSYTTEARTDPGGSWYDSVGGPKNIDPLQVMPGTYQVSVTVTWLLWDNTNRIYVPFDYTTAIFGTNPNQPGYYYAVVSVDYPAPYAWYPNPNCEGEPCPTSDLTKLSMSERDMQNFEYLMTALLKAFMFGPMGTTRFGG